jgi:hypothetical protein
VNGSARVEIGTPIATETRPSDAGARDDAAGLSIASARSRIAPRLATSRAMQRAPLPHCSTSVPSALKMR